MNIVKHPQSIGVDYHVINEERTRADVFYSQTAFKTEEEIEQFVTECQKQRDEAEQAMRDYIHPEQAKIQELEAVIVDKEAVIAQKVEYVADLTKQIVDAKLEPVKEKPIGISELPLEEVKI